MNLRNVLPQSNRNRYLVLNNTKLTVQLFIRLFACLFKTEEKNIKINLHSLNTNQARDY